MATALTIPTVNAYTSADITLSAGTTIVFSITGTHNGAPVVVRKKDSQNAYWPIVEKSSVNGLRIAESEDLMRIISVNNPSATTMTLQVFKPESSTASGIDQD
jgi:hypothetical protein